MLGDEWLRRENAAPYRRKHDVEHEGPNAGSHIPNRARDMREGVDAQIENDVQLQGQVFSGI